MTLTDIRAWYFLSLWVLQIMHLVYDYYCFMFLTYLLLSGNWSERQYLCSLYYTWDTAQHLPSLPYYYNFYEISHTRLSHTHQPWNPLLHVANIFVRLKRSIVSTSLKYSVESWVAESVNRVRGNWQKIKVSWNLDFSPYMRLWGED
jgi:hypothetical protein